MHMSVEPPVESGVGVGAGCSVGLPMRVMLERMKRAL